MKDVGDNMPSRKFLLSKQLQINSDIKPFSVYQNINRSIFSLTLPAIVSNITIPLLGLIDTAIVGHLGATAYIGAIAIGSIVFSMMYWLLGFLRMGTGGLTAVANGAADTTEIKHILSRSLSIAFLLSLAIIVLQVPIFRAMMWFYAPPEGIKPLVASYFRILVWGAPFVMATTALTGWFIGMKNTRYPMIIAIVQNVVNIFCSLLLVYVFKMRIEGVALGTLISQVTGGILAFAFCQHLSRKQGIVGCDEPLLLWQSLNVSRLLGDSKSEWGKFFSIHRDIFLRTLCMVAVMTFIPKVGAQQGEEILAANTLLMQFYMIVSYFMDGYATAGEALGGNYYGAHDVLRFRILIRKLFLVGFVTAFVFSLAYAFAGNLFLSWLTDKAEVVNQAIPYIPYVVVMPYVSFVAFILDGVFAGTTMTRGLLLSVFSGALAFFLLYLLLFPSYANHGLWVAYLSFLLIRSIVLWIFLPRIVRKM